jgi:hypothetical protein
MGSQRQVNHSTYGCHKQEKRSENVGLCFQEDRTIEGNHVIYYIFIQVTTEHIKFGG